MVNRTDTDDRPGGHCNTVGVWYGSYLNEGGEVFFKESCFDDCISAGGTIERITDEYDDGDSETYDHCVIHSSDCRSFMKWDWWVDEDDRSYPYSYCDVGCKLSG